MEEAEVRLSASDAIRTIEKNGMVSASRLIGDVSRVEYDKGVEHGVRSVCHAIRETIGIK